MCGEFASVALALCDFVSSSFAEPTYLVHGEPDPSSGTTIDLVAGLIDLLSVLSLWWTVLGDDIDRGKGRSRLLSAVGGSRFQIRQREESRCCAADKQTVAVASVVSLAAAGSGCSSGQGRRPRAVHTPEILWHGRKNGRHQDVRDMPRGLEGTAELALRPFVLRRLPGRMAVALRSQEGDEDEVSHLQGQDPPVEGNGDNNARLPC